MRLYRFDPAAGRAISLHGSQGLTQVRLLRPAAALHVSAMHLAPGGQVGRHRASVPQLFLVVAGTGWVTGQAGVRRPVEPGRAAFWAGGEEHAAGTGTGLLAIVIEGDGLEPDVDLPELLEPAE